MDTVLALDVGGTRIKGAVMSRDGSAVSEIHELTGSGPEDGVSSVLDALAELKRHPAASRSRAAGLALPGIVDTATGHAVWSGNMRWRDVPFRELAEARIGIPVAVGHDVRAGGLAEHHMGAARGHDNALVVPIGTGIAAAIIADGRVVDCGGLAGELGHIDVGFDEPCACGAVGCAEAVGSGAAIARRYSRRTGIAVNGAADVLQRKRAGDPAAAAVWRDAVDALARALAIACSLVAPSVIVIAGGLALAGRELLGPLAGALSARLTFQLRPDVVPAAFGDRAGCVGAGLLAWRLADGRIRP